MPDAPAIPQRGKPAAISVTELAQRHHLLRALGAEEMRELLNRARPQRFAAGQAIFRKGDRGDGMYGVLSGSVACTVFSSAGKELILNMFGPGEFFGEIALLDGAGRTADTVAREASELLFIARSAFLPFLEQRPQVAMRMIALLCERLRRTTQLLEDSAFLNVATRLAKGLTGMAVAGGRNTSDGRIEILISQDEMARTLGVSREMVSRQLAIWREAGLVDLSRGRIVLRDSDALDQVLTGG